MELHPITAENITDAWDLFQRLMIEQNSLKYVKIDFEDFKRSFLEPQMTHVRGVIGYMDDAPIAMATYCYGYTIYRAQPVLNFKTFYVAPEHRKQGFGRQILRYLHAAAEQDGCAYLQWSVLNDNEAAITYYQKMFFIPEQDISDYVVSVEEFKNSINQ